MHETSTGVLYDMNLICDFCRKNQLFLVVDAISSYMADPIDMRKQEIDVLVIASQKALACPPGISVIVMSERAVNRLAHQKTLSMYFDLKDALKNGERGQTPFTPAVGILRQINARLREVEQSGGIEKEINRVAELASDFRNKIVDLPFTILSSSLSNAVTPIQPNNVSAYQIFLTLKDEYNIWVCPNGGDLKEKVFSGWTYWQSDERRQYKFSKFVARYEK